MTTTSGPRSFHRPALWAFALGVLLIAAVLAPPAHAQQVDVHDPKGDAPFYDISHVTVKHRAERVRFEIDAYDRTPYGYHAFIDVPGGEKWEYVVLWAGYTPHKVFVQTRKQWASLDDIKCTVRSAHQTLTDVEFSVPTRCFKHPAKLRVRVKGWDDEAGYTDRTHWSKWAIRA